MYKETIGHHITEWIVGTAVMLGIFVRCQYWSNRKTSLLMENLPSLLSKVLSLEVSQPSFKCPKLHFKAKFLLDILLLQRELLGKYTTQQHTHTIPKRSMQVCIQHSCTLNIILKKQQFPLGNVYILSLWKSLATDLRPVFIYFVQEASWPSTSMRFWDPMVAKSPGQALAADAVQQVNHQVALCKNACPFLPDWGL